jgi:hypothetical protein
VHEGSTGAISRAPLRKDDVARGLVDTFRYSGGTSDSPSSLAAVVPLSLVLAFALQAVRLPHEARLGQEPGASRTRAARLSAFRADPPVVVGDLGHSVTTGLANWHATSMGRRARNPNRTDLFFAGHGDCRPTFASPSRTYPRRALAKREADAPQVACFRPKPPGLLTSVYRSVDSWSESNRVRLLEIRSFWSLDRAP